MTKFHPKDKPLHLENIRIYSDKGQAGRCPTCAGLNSLKNERCLDCGQKLFKVNA